MTDAQTEARAIAEWQPIATAPREPVVSGATFGPMILLGSVYGQRAIGYWGRGAGNQREGWVNPHDHMVMDYWGQFTHWQTLPDIPENDDDA